MKLDVGMVWKIHCEVSSSSGHAVSASAHVLIPKFSRNDLTPTVHNYCGKQDLVYGLQVSMLWAQADLRWLTEVHQHPVGRFRYACLIFWHIFFLSWWWGSWTHYDHDSIISRELCTVLRFLLFSLLPSSTVRRAKRKGRDAVPWPDLLISRLCISHLLHLLVQYWMLYL